MTRRAFGRRSTSALPSSTWDVYHVENFLLEPTAIRAAVATLAGGDTFADDAEVLEALKSSAASIVDRLILEEVQTQVNDSLVSAISVGEPAHTTPGRSQPLDYRFA